MLDTIIYIPTILAYAFISLLVVILSFIVIYVSHKVYVLIYESLPMPDLHTLMPAEDSGRHVPDSTAATVISPDILPGLKTPTTTPAPRSEWTAVQHIPVPIVTDWDQSSEMTSSQKYAMMKPTDVGQLNDLQAGNLNGKLKPALRIVVKLRPTYLAYVIYEARIPSVKRKEPRVDNKLIKYYDRLSAIPHGSVMQHCQQAESPSQSDDDEPEIQFPNRNYSPGYQRSTSISKRKSQADYQQPVMTNALVDRDRIRDKERPMSDILKDREQEDYPIIIRSDPNSNRERPYSPLDMHQSDTQRNSSADYSQTQASTITDRERPDISSKAQRSRNASERDDVVVDKARPNNNIRSDKQRPIINFPSQPKRLSMNMEPARQLLSNIAMKPAQQSNSNQPRRRKRMSASNENDSDDEDELKGTPSGMALVRQQGKQ